MLATHQNLIACHHCGHIHDLPSLDDGQLIRCHHCGNELYTQRRNWFSKAGAMAVTGLILFVISNAFPFLSIEVAGLEQSTTLLSGVSALFDRDEILLASLVFGTIFMFPLLELLTICYLLACRAMNIHGPGIKTLLSTLLLAKPWNMLEVFLLSVIVTSVKLGDMATLIPGTGVFAFSLLVVLLIATHLQLNHHQLWHWVRPENHFTLADSKRLYACSHCEALIGDSLWRQDPHCPRCGHKVAPRIRNSFQKTLALLIASMILYIPANTLPIMTVYRLGLETSNTILSGVVHLFQDGMWVIAAVVFIASVLVPVAKMLVLGYLLWSTYQGSTKNERYRTRLYRVIEFVGRWSMVDVFVVTLLMALVQFGLLANIEPGAAIGAFAAVVILTMLAAETFDPRLLWDTRDDQQRT